VKTVLATINSRYTQSSLALLYLESIIVREFSNISIKRLESNLSFTTEEFASEILSEKPDIVCFSVYLWNRKATQEVISYIKSVNEDIFIIVGGPEITYDCVCMMNECSGIDYCIIGEGEDNFRFLLSELYNGNTPDSRKGLIYRENISESFIIPDEVEDLSSIPSPLQTGVFPSDRNFMHYESSRGCPFSCAYCLSAAKKKVRYFPLRRIYKDLDYFFASELKMLRFVDRTFNLDKEHFLPIWKYIIEYGPKDKHYQFEIDASLFDEETLNFLVKNYTDNFQFEIGVQSISSRALENVNRPNKIDRIFKISEFLLKNTKIHIHLDLISGLPGDNRENFMRGIDRIAFIMPHTIQIGRLKILKGSPLEKSVEKFNIVYFKSPPYYILKNNDFSWKDIMEIEKLSRINELIYNSERYFNFIRALLSKGKKYTEFLKEMNEMWQNNKMNYFGIAQKNIVKILVKYIDGDETLLQALLHDILMKADFKYDPMAAFKEFERFFIKREDVFRADNSVATFYPVKPIKLVRYTINPIDQSKRKEYFIYYLKNSKREFIVISEKEVKCGNKVLYEKIKPLIKKGIFRKLEI